MAHKKLFKIPIKLDPYLDGKLLERIYARKQQRNTVYLFTNYNKKDVRDHTFELEIGVHCIYYIGFILSN